MNSVGPRPHPNALLRTAGGAPRFPRCPRGHPPHPPRPLLHRPRAFFPFVKPLVDPPVTPPPSWTSASSFRRLNVFPHLHHLQAFTDIFRFQPFFSKEGGLGGVQTMFLSGAEYLSPPPLPTPRPTAQPLRQHCQLLLESGSIVLQFY